ncbi:MAG: hypothetical protein NTW87_17125 [Planctomycetota bacterium]|nr:hypothetical protein [Planctomycetota bacterium]
MDDDTDNERASTAPLVAKKRPWFQFHLSTAIILMFVAGGLLWANVRLHTQRVDLFFGESRVVSRFEAREWGNRTVRGWPLDYMQHSLVGKWYFAPGNLVIDAAVTIVLLLGVAILAESLFHHSMPTVSDPPGQPRPWFRLHLSTLLVMALVTSALVWLQDATAWRSGAVYWGFPFHAYANNEITSVPAYLANLSINLGMVAATAITCERLIRRRERRQ